MKEFALDIMTPAGESFSGSMGQLIIKTTSGELGIMAGHTDYLASVVPCVAKVTDTDGHGRNAFCGGGFISVVKGSVSVVVDEFIFGEELSQEETREQRDSLQAEYAACDSKKEPEKAAYLKTALARAEAKYRATKN